MNCVKVLIIIFVLFFNHVQHAMAEEPAAPPTTKVWANFEKAFQDGVLAYQAKKYDEASNAFQFAVQQDSTNVQAVTNYALVLFQLGKQIESLAYMRKAYALDPEFDAANQGLKYLEKHIQVKEIPHQISLWENLHESVFASFKRSGFLFFNLLSTLGCFWFLLSYLGRRKRALAGQGDLPTIPASSVLFVILFVLSTVLLLAKIYDDQVSRGTVIVDKVVVYSAPATDSVQLYEINGGSEVQLEMTRKEGDTQWLQITYPGAATGWVQAPSVLQTSGRSL